MNKTATIIEGILRLAVVISFQFISVGWDTRDEFLYDMEAEGLRALTSIDRLLTFIFCLVCVLMLVASATLLLMFFIKATRLWFKIIPVIILVGVLAFIRYVGYPELVKNMNLYLFLIMAMLCMAFVSFRAWAQKRILVSVTQGGG